MLPNWSALLVITREFIIYEHISAEFWTQTLIFEQCSYFSHIFFHFFNLPLTHLFFVSDICICYYCTFMAVKTFTMKFGMLHFACSYFTILLVLCIYLLNIIKFLSLFAHSDECRISMLSLLILKRSLTTSTGN